MLHLGCADRTQLSRKLRTSDFLHKIICNVANITHGIDSDEDSINIMKQFGYDNLFIDNVESINNNNVDKDYDVVVAAEIIEHVGNPKQMLTAIRRHLVNNGVLIITTPNPISLRFFLHYILGEEISSGYHVVAFTFSTIFNLLNMNGFQVVGTYGTQPTGYKSARHSASKPLIDLILKSFPRFGDQIVIVSKKLQI